jgi:hypothetical protein
MKKLTLIVLLLSLDLQASAKLKVTIKDVVVSRVAKVGCAYDLPIINLGVGVACETGAGDVALIRETSNISPNVEQHEVTNESFEFDYGEVIKECVNGGGKEVYLALFSDCMEDTKPYYEYPHKVYKILDKRFPREMVLDLYNGFGTYIFGKSAGIKATVFIESINN